METFYSEFRSMRQRVIIVETATSTLQNEAFREAITHCKVNSSSSEETKVKLNSGPLREAIAAIFTHSKETKRKEFQIGLKNYDTQKNNAFDQIDENACNRVDKYLDSVSS